MPFGRHRSVAVAFLSHTAKEIQTGQQAASLHQFHRGISRDCAPASAPTSSTSAGWGTHDGRDR